MPWFFGGLHGLPVVGRTRIFELREERRAVAEVVGEGFAAGVLCR